MVKNKKAFDFEKEFFKMRMEIQGMKAIIGIYLVVFTAIITFILW